MGVADAGGGLGFTEEPAPVKFAGMAAREDQLERDHAVQGCLTALVNDTHAPSPQLAQQFEAGWNRGISSMLVTDVGIDGIVAAV